MSVATWGQVTIPQKLPSSPACVSPGTAAVADPAKAFSPTC